MPKNDKRLLCDWRNFRRGPRCNWYWTKFNRKKDRVTQQQYETIELPYQGLNIAKPHLGGFQMEHFAQGTWCPAVLLRICKDKKIKTATDIGCGAGHTVELMHALGVEAIGIDGCPAALERSVVPTHTFIHDYCDNPLYLEPRDLAWSAEFVEHVDEEFIPNFFATFKCHHYLALTHALPGDLGYHHVNCQPAEYWLERLKDAGFEYNERYSKHLRAKTRQRDPAARCIRRSLLFLENKEWNAEPVKDAEQSRSPTSDG